MGHKVVIVVEVTRPPTSTRSLSWMASVVLCEHQELRGPTWDSACVDRTARRLVAGADELELELVAGLGQDRA